MKKIFYLIAATTVVFATHSYAQQLRSAHGELKNMPVKEYPSPGNISNTTWYDVPGGFIVKYHFNDVDYRVSYGHKGDWLYTIRVYNENILPPYIRQMVKASYHDYNVVLVEEIEKPADISTYIIHLEGKNAWINVRVRDGEMDEWQRISKSF